MSTISSGAGVAVQSAERILVVCKFRPTMGDTIVATPFLRQLRQYAPKAVISLITSPVGAVALQDCPYVDEMVPIKSRELGQSYTRYTLNLLARLRAGRYSALFIPYRSRYILILCALSGIPLRIGFASKSGGSLLTVAAPYWFDRHESSCHLDLLREIGAPTEEALPEIWISDSERQSAGRTLARYGVCSDSRLLAVQPGANDARNREWGAKRFAAAADALAETMGAQVVLMGGESERETAARTEAAMCTRPVNLVGELKLREALAMIGHFRLWLGNDTGMLHAAVAQRVPSVGIYGPTKAPRWGYDTPQHRSVVYYPERPVDDERYIRLHGEPGGPGRSRRRWDPLLRGCLDAISVERVVAEARSALEAASSGSTTSPFFSVTSGGRRS